MIKFSHLINRVNPFSESSPSPSHVRVRVKEMKNVCACVRLALSGAIFDRLINDILPPLTTLFLRMIFWRLPPWTRWNLTNFGNNQIQQEVLDIPNLFRGNFGCLAILKTANRGKWCSTLTAPLDE